MRACRAPANRRSLPEAIASRMNSDPSKVTTTGHTAEFTGERVIPGQVDADLWNEHMSRYAFAAEAARERLVLDIACGAGYGTAALRSHARCVIGIDISSEAVAFAHQNYSRPGIGWAQASATSLPFRSRSFDLVAAFEVIEHLVDWQALLSEAARVLAPGGTFIVSTPNKSFYAESRGEAGPNPFHEHEFEFDEFRAALEAAFPFVAIFTQDHAEAIVFRETRAGNTGRVLFENTDSGATEASFFVAVCSHQPLIDRTSFTYVPRAANVLRERQRHIVRLQGELETKDAWLQKALGEHEELVVRFRAQHDELERSNEWAAKVDAQLKQVQLRVQALQDELRQEQEAGRQVAAGYEERLAEQERELVSRTEWARDLEREVLAVREELRQQNQELLKAVELLDRAEATVVERTEWAQRLDRERAELSQKLAAAGASRWVRVGRTFGVGPDLRIP